MLVFTRKRDEAVVIDDGIAVRILRLGHDGVRLGVTAPSDVTVHRHEVDEMVKAANASAEAGESTLVEQLAEPMRRAVDRGETIPTHARR